MEYTYDTRFGYSIKTQKKVGVVAILMMGAGVIGMMWGAIFTLFAGVGLILFIPSLMLFRKGLKRYKMCVFIERVAKVNDPNVTEDNVVHYLGYTEEEAREYTLMAQKYKLIDLSY